MASTLVIFPLRYPFFLTIFFSSQAPVIDLDKADGSNNLGQTLDLLVEK